MPVPANAGSNPVPEGADGKDAFAIAQMLYSKMLDEILSKSEDVGTGFAAEARKIHREEAPARSIRGKATDEADEADAKDAADEADEADEAAAKDDAGGAAADAKDADGKERDS